MLENIEMNVNKNDEIHHYLHSRVPVLNPNLIARQSDLKKMYQRFVMKVRRLM